MVIQFYSNVHFKNGFNKSNLSTCVFDKTDVGESICHLRFLQKPVMTAADAPHILPAGKERNKQKSNK